MQVTFKMELTVEIREDDSVTKPALIAAIKEYTQELYSLSTMISRRKVNVSITTDDDDAGIVHHALFEKVVETTEGDNA